MRKINYIVVHCSATREDCTLSPIGICHEDGLKEHRVTQVFKDTERR